MTIRWDNVIPLDAVVVPGWNAIPQFEHPGYVAFPLGPTRSLAEIWGLESPKQWQPMSTAPRTGEWFMVKRFPRQNTRHFEVEAKWVKSLPHTQVWRLRNGQLSWDNDLLGWRPIE